MSSRDPRQPPESAPYVLELRGDPLAAPYAPQPAPEGPEADLLRLLPEVARRGRRPLALGLLAGLGFGVAYLCLAAPIYVVKALVHVELRRSVIREVEARPGATYVGTQAEVIQSPAMVAAAIRAIGLPEPEEPGVLARARAWIEAVNPFHSEEAVDPIQRAVLATLPALQATPVLGTDVLAVTLRTDGPQRGVRLLDALVAGYQRYLRDNEAAAQREGLDLLRRRGATLAAEIDRIAEVYRERESAIRSAGAGPDALALQRVELAERARARLEAERRRIGLENELAALRQERDAGVASAEIQGDLARSEAALAELRARLSDRHPDVAQQEQRVAGLREQIRAGARRRAAELEREARAARGTEAALAALHASEWERVEERERELALLDQLGAEIARLESERGGVRALLAEKELALLAARSGENSGTLVRVLQAPSVPASPVWPLPLPVVVACSLVGLLGGLGFALRAKRSELRGRTLAPQRFGERGEAEAGLPRIDPQPLQER